MHIGNYNNSIELSISAGPFTVITIMVFLILAKLTGAG